jgi:hypothetical protein
MFLILALILILFLLYRPSTGQSCYYSFIGASLVVLYLKWYAVEYTQGGF